MDANSYSQYWQNETIKLIDNQRWIAGRAFGMLKPIALIVDIAKNIFLSLKNIFSLSNSRKHLKLTLLFALDMFNSPIINLIDPNIYTIQITQFNKEKSELQDQIQDLTELTRDGTLKNSELAAQLQKVNETSMRLVAENTQLNEERLNLQNQIQDLTELTRDGALKNSELAAQLQKVNDTWKLQVADLTEQLQGVNETCQKQYETYDRQLTQLAEEKSSLEKEIATLTKSKMDEENRGVLVETSDCGTPQETSSAASLPQTSSSLDQASSSIDQASSSLGIEATSDNELYLQYNLVRETGDESVLQKLKEEAGKENSQAQYYLGQLFWRGEGVKQDATLAKQYLEAAAKQKHLWACFYLGCFLEGSGTPTDKARALGLYKEIPRGGAPFLAQLFSMDRRHWPEGASSVFDLFEIDQMIEVAKDNTEDGEEVQLKLARIYQIGTKVIKNIQEAVKWYKEAAKLGSLDAMLALAKIYENGDGEVVQDRKKSKKLFIKVLENASFEKDMRSEAIVALARMYFLENDFDAYSALTKDYRPLATLASQRRDKVENLLLGISNCESKEYLVELGRNHEIEKNNIAKAIRFYKKARDLGSVNASNELKRLGCL